MPIRENFGFETDEYRAEVSRSSTALLQQQEIAMTRKFLVSSFAVGAGVGGAYFTGGLTGVIAAYKSRSTWVAHKKHEIIQAELSRRNVALHDVDFKDAAISYTAGTAAMLVGAEIGNFTESATNVDSMGSHVPDGETKSYGLTDNVGKAAEGAGGQIHQLAEHITGGDSTTVAAQVAVTDANAYHAGMVQAQILEEHLGNETAEAVLLALTNPPEPPGRKCSCAHGVEDLSCDECEEKIAYGNCYFHCCTCHGDNYDICLKCITKGVYCKNKSHTLKKLLAKPR
ncbi:hypothetical protein F4677DRAFT_432289 [Hypoxylon crocopeplum]|nr:hypothetical protein F4677DRAFT_432289 [Hypoxylon crocopeplum]